MIEISHLQKSFDQLQVLRDINLVIPSGEIFGIVGRSGAGKSTLLRCLNGLECYDSGSLKVDGTEVGTLNNEELRLARKNMGMVFQHFSLLSRATVYENVALAMRIWGCDAAAIDARVRELLELVEIPAKIDSKARELSGGQKQRVAIARALAMNPNILLCDEATSALDPKSTMAILNLLKDINQRFKITIILVTHEMEVIKSLCDKIAIMENGEIKECGQVRDIFLKRPPALQNLLGEMSELPAQGCNLEFSFGHNDEDGRLLTRMARELDIDFSVVSRESLKLKEESIESVVINLEDGVAQKVERYLKDKNINCKHRVSGV